MQETELLTKLEGVGRLIANHEAALVDLYATRLRLFQMGRAQHGTTNKRLGEAAGCKENSVIAALRKADKQAATDKASADKEPAGTTSADDATDGDA